MNRELADRWCERGILGAVLGMLLFMPLAFGGRGQLPAGFWGDFIILNPFIVAELLTLVSLQTPLPQRLSGREVHSLVRLHSYGNRPKTRTHEAGQKNSSLTVHRIGG